MSHIIELTAGSSKVHGNLYWNASNQLLRKIGKFSSIYIGGVDGGTVRDENGDCWDWWPTEERIAGLPESSPFRVIRIVKAS